MGTSQRNVADCDHQCSAQTVVTEEDILNLESAWWEVQQHFACHNHQRGDLCMNNCSTHTIYISTSYNQETYIGGMILVPCSCSNVLIHCSLPISCSQMRQLVLIVVCSVITMNVFRPTKIPMKLFLGTMKKVFQSMCGVVLLLMSL
jgi:hypothetical protein